jgi:hypothetical protein
VGTSVGQEQESETEEMKAIVVIAYEAYCSLHTVARFKKVY